MMDQPIAAGAEDEGYPAARYSWYVVGVLTAAYTISFIDRQILALMVGPIKKDLAISDTQMSLLIGLAFALFYTLLGLPIARIADRFNRRTLIAGGIVVWCAMTACCGLARNYAQLFLARIGVGVGEAVLSPSALSMLSDYFPPRTRGRAIAVYSTGITLGTGLAMILGGELLEYVLAAEPVRLPFFGELYAWQTVFLVVGLPGLLVALVMATVKEPVRRERLELQTPGGALPMSHVVGFLSSHRRMYLSHFLGMSTVVMLAYGLYAWVPSMFIRTWGWSISQIGVAYGIVTLAAGPLAATLSSWLGERFMKRQRQDAHMRAVAWIVLMTVIGALLATVMPNPWLALVMLTPAAVGTTAATGSGLSALMTITPNQMRAQVSALYFLVVNLFGLTIGPTGVALFTDYVFHDESSLRYSILCMTAMGGVAAALLLSYNLRHYREAYVESQRWAGT